MLNSGDVSLVEPKPHILVVDDEAQLRRLLAEYLSDEGYSVETAPDGLHAVEALAARNFELVLSDVRMPGLDGLGLLAQISRGHPDVGVLILTACEDCRWPWVL